MRFEIPYRRSPASWLLPAHALCKSTRSVAPLPLCQACGPSMSTIPSCETRPVWLLHPTPLGALTLVSARKPFRPGSTHLYAPHYLFTTTSCGLRHMHHATKLMPSAKGPVLVAWKRHMAMRKMKARPPMMPPTMAPVRSWYK